MEQKFGNNSIDLELLRNFCEQEGQSVEYQKGEWMECEGDPAQWFGFVAEGCFKYVTRGLGDGREHITWFSFSGEFVGDYPSCLDGSPSQTTIEAMLPSHLLSQARARYLDFHRATARERYELLLHRCPGIVEHLPLNAISSFLCITPQMLSKIRKDITFHAKE